MIRRMLVLSATVFASLALTAVLATSAGAQYVPGTPGIVVNPSTVTVGGTFTVEGSGCPANATVTIQINGITVGTTTSNGEGDFLTGNITLPPSITAGQYIVHALCGSLDLTAVLSVSALAPVTTATVATSLPVTGTNSGEWIKGGLSLVAIGGLLVLATRRRRAVV